MYGDVNTYELHLIMNHIDFIADFWVSQIRKTVDPGNSNKRKTGAQIAIFGNIGGNERK